MKVHIGVLEVLALRASTGKAFGVYPDGGLLAGFSTHSMAAPAEALALQPTMRWR
jgi:hypothetical protein